MKRKKQENQGDGMRAFQQRMSRPHLCECCKSTLLPPCSLRFCVDCRALLVEELLMPVDTHNPKENQ